MAELADALDSGSSEVTLIQVQVLLSAPQKESFNRKVGAFLFVLGRSGLEPFQAPAIRTTKKKASIVRSELFFLSRLVDTQSAPSNLYRSAGLVACGPVFVSSRSCRNLDLPACSPVQHPRPIVGDGVKRTVFIQVVALQRQLANHRKISRIVDPHARIVPRDGISCVRAKAEIVFLQAKSKCFFLSGYQNFLLKSIRHLNKESCRQTAKYTKILDILPSPPYNRKNHSAKAA